MEARRQIIDSKLSRRELMKLGLLTSGGWLLANSGWSVRADDLPVSPRTTPFIEPLPIPPLARPVEALSPAPTIAPNSEAGEARTRDHQRFREFPPVRFFEQRIREADHRFHPELPVNKVWGFDGVVPGPTFHARYGEPILVRRHNDLPADHVGFGIPQITTHLHNGHTPSESDGFPGDFFDPGFFYDQHYPNIYAGFDHFGAPGDPREALSTLWYHDHRVEFTAQNVYKGLAGFNLLFDAIDSGDEEDTRPGALRLPSGEFDVPLIVADKLFDSAGQLFFDPFGFDGLLGDKFTVNGKIQPFFEVHPRKYRFRLLNGGPSRFYEFFLTELDRPSTSNTFVQISNDGNLLPRPLTRTSVRLGVAERVDLIVDFSRFKPGTRIHLENRLQQKNGRGPTGEILPAGTGDLVLQFDVVLPEVRDPSQVPERLRDLPPSNLEEVVATRRFEFSRSNGGWQINGQFFDVNRIDANPKKGTAEVWALKNGGGGWSHPIHIHLEEFQILARDGAPPPQDEVARKDIVRLGPGEEVKLFLRFRDFQGRYPMHCHNLLHEDHAMMLRFEVEP